MAAESFGTWVLSDSSVKDRHNTIVDVESMKLDNFLRNPIATVNHDPNRAIGFWANIKKQAGKLVAELMIDPEASSSAREAAALIRAKVLRACSIEFIGQQVGDFFRDVEMVACSVVSVPSNPAALRLERSSPNTYFQIINQETRTMTENTEQSSTGGSVNPEPVSRAPLAPSVHTKQHTYSLGRAIALQADGRLNGMEAEIDSELRNRQPWRTISGFAAPLEAFGLKKRANAATAGGNLAPLTGTGHADALFAQIDGGISNELLTERVGVQMLTGLTEASINIPRQTGRATAGHVALDSALPTSADATFSNAVMTPKLAGAVSTVNLSAALAQHPRVGTDFIGAELGRALAEEINRAFLVGNSTATPAEPNGLATLATATGVTVDPASGAIASFDAIKKSLLDYLKDPSAPAAWIIRYDFLDKLKNSAAFTGSNNSVYAELGLLNNTLSGYPVLQTSAFAATATTEGYFGQFSTMVHGIWEAVSVVVNPWSDDVFDSGAAKVRVMLLHDFQAVDPKRIRKFAYDLS